MVTPAPGPGRSSGSPVTGDQEHVSRGTLWGQHWGHTEPARTTCGAAEEAHSGSSRLSPRHLTPRFTGAEPSPGRERGRVESPGGRWGRRAAGDRAPLLLGRSQAPRVRDRRCSSVSVEAAASARPGNPASLAAEATDSRQEARTREAASPAPAVPITTTGLAAPRPLCF